MNFDNITNEILDKIDLSELSENIKNEEYKNYFLSKSSKEHYRLLSYISLENKNIKMMDIGTLKGCSSLAMSINNTNEIYSFDISDSFDLHMIPKNVNYFIDNVLKAEYKLHILDSKFILLDTFHDGTFENTFYNYLNEIGYKGVLILDDIYLNNEMVSFWNSISVKKKDLTNLGHITGTGIVYFN